MIMMMSSSNERRKHCQTMLYHKTPSLVMMMILLVIASTIAITNAFEYQIKNDEDQDPQPSLQLTDIETSINKLKTVFVNDKIQVDIVDLEWELVEGATAAAESNGTDNSFLYWTTSVDGIEQASGSSRLSSFGRLLPDKITVGEIVVTSSKIHTIEVTVTIDGNSKPFELTKDVVAIQPLVSLIPLIVVLILAVTTQMVRDYFFGHCSLLLLYVYQMACLC
jgi:hypothetical protein